MDYKTYALMAILLASVASVALVGAASAQTTLTVETDADSYTTGDDITVTGQLDTTTINQPLLIQVLDPQGNRDKIDQFDANPTTGAYTYTFRAGGTMNTDGEYTVIVSYKGSTTEETTFQFDSTDTGVSWRPFTFEAGGEDYTIQYIITGGSITSVSASSETSSLTVEISSTADGTLQLRLPREVIDSRTGEDGRTGDDDEFVAFADEVPADVEENDAANTASVRQISIDFEQGTGSIEVVGTYAVPEFGAIAAIILAVAIVGIIVATARYGKFNFAPRL
jgi:predicted secreted protein with PEFG-CTERM motif